MIRYWISFVSGLIFALAISLVYLFGSIPIAIRPIIPYAVALVLLILSLISTIIVCRKDIWIGLYARTIIIAAVIFLIFALFLVGTAIIPAGALKVILTIIGSTSFGLTLMIFIGSIFHLLRKNL